MRNPVKELIKNFNNVTSQLLLTKVRSLPCEDR